MAVDLHGAAEAHFLEFAGLGLAGLLLLGFLVLELAVVHDLADGRSRVWRDLHEVKTKFIGAPASFVGFNDSHHLARLVDQSDGRNADAVVQSRAGRWSVAPRAVPTKSTGTRPGTRVERGTARRKAGDRRVLRKNPAAVSTVVHISRSSAAVDLGPQRSRCRWRLYPRSPMASKSRRNFCG